MASHTELEAKGKASDNSTVCPLNAVAVSTWTSRGF